MLATALLSTFLLLLLRCATPVTAQNVMMTVTCTCDPTTGTPSTGVQNAMAAYNYWAPFYAGLNFTSCPSNGQCQTTTAPLSHNTAITGTGLCGKVAIAGSNTNIFRFCTIPMKNSPNLASASLCYTSASGYTLCFCNTQNLCNGTAGTRGCFLVALAFALVALFMCLGSYMY